MTHPKIGEWTDFVRGVTRGPRAERLDRHLDGGCRACASRVALLQRVADDARRQTREHPPESSLHWVRAYFALRQPVAGWRHPLFDLQLAWDSATSPRPSGIRGGQGSSRELRFESVDYALVVSLHESERPGHARLAGQLLSEIGEPLVGVPAGVLVRGELVGNSYTGEMGFFEIEFPPRYPIELRLLPYPECRIRARIDDPEG